MRWDKKELDELVPFIKKHKNGMNSISWNQIALLWAQRFGKKRSVESIRGKYNQQNWGWVPKESRARVLSTGHISKIKGGRRNYSFEHTYPEPAAVTIDSRDPAISDLVTKVKGMLLDVLETLENR
ncbi:hypothetical protein MAP00_007620 [Monascus purpureus]|nr:hypothetical protein MAP00_007620 [Monascus purpureus]